ncbi:MAG TPA: hypothetical protein VF548_07465 [Allosphingosinicella sp.]
MIARGFKSVIWVAAVGGAALSCYMVSLRVATERNELEKVERQIIAAKRDIRSLQTELGTRGRMGQLEQWNAEVLALAAPSSAQFLKDEFTLARLYRNDPTVADRSAEMRLASAETGASKSAGPGKPVTPPAVQAVAERPAAQAPMIHQASFTTGQPESRPKPAAETPAKPKPAEQVSAKPKPVQQASATPKPVQQASAKPKPASAKPGAERTASSAPAKSAPDRSKPTGKPAKTEALSSRTTAKPAAKAETLRTAASAAKPVREASAAPRAKGKGGGGN